MELEHLDVRGTTHLKECCGQLTGSSGDHAQLPGLLDDRGCLLFCLDGKRS